MTHLHSLPDGYQLDDFRLDAFIGGGGFGLVYRISDVFYLSCGVLWSSNREGNGAKALNFLSGKVHLDNPSGGGHRRVLPVRSY